MSVAEKSYVDFAGLTISPLSPTIGAEVSGVDMGQALSNDQRATLYQAMLDWKVLFFRDQDVSREEHIAFARNFGELEVHPFAPHAEGYREILAIGHDGEHPGRENLWHSDVTWRLQPSLGSILRCQEGPDLGGDTLFSDMYAAYEGLPAEVRDKIDGLVAVHDFPGFRANLRKRGVDEEQIAAFIEEYPNPEHPVVRTHPDTGRNTIYVNGAFTQRIVGMDEDESARLLKYLYSQAAVPEYQCRFRWRQNSVAFWDNRACQHYASSDYWPNKRLMDRVTIIGDTPFHNPDTAPVDHDESPFRGRLARIRNGDLSSGY